MARLMGWGERFRTRREWDGETPQRPIVASPADSPNTPPRAQVAAAGIQPEAECLRRAACILRSRSLKPDGLAMRVLCDVLTDTADKIASGA